MAIYIPAEPSFTEQLSKDMNLVGDIVGLAANIKGMQYAASAEERAKAAAVRAEESFGMQKEQYEYSKERRPTQEAIEEQNLFSAEQSEERAQAAEKRALEDQEMQRRAEIREVISWGQRLVETGLNIKSVIAANKTRKLGDQLTQLSIESAKTKAANEERDKILSSSDFAIRASDSILSDIKARTPLGQRITDPGLLEKAGQAILQKETNLYQAAIAAGKTPAEATVLSKLGVEADWNFVTKGKTREEYNDKEKVDFAYTSDLLNDAGQNALREHLRNGGTPDEFDIKPEYKRDRGVEALERDLTDGNYVKLVRDTNPVIGDAILFNQRAHVSSYRRGVTPQIVIIKEGAGMFRGDTELVFTPDELGKAVKSGQISLTEVAQHDAMWALPTDAKLSAMEKATTTSGERNLQSIINSVKAGDVQSVSREDIDWLVTQIGEDATRGLINEAVKAKQKGK